MKEDIIETFANLGFAVDHLEEGILAFFFEGIRMVMMPNDDENLLVLAIPCVANNSQLTKENMTKIMNVANYELRFTKLYTPNGKDVWISYEYKILEEKYDLELILTHMIQYLALGKNYLDKLICSVYKTNHMEKNPNDQIT
ncbi:MAG: hypothetical protein KBT20_06170 [Bacteroidales bacterium]|nr:hypothetical protein [Candidatus Liminaster caballi]